MKIRVPDNMRFEFSLDHEFANAIPVNSPACEHQIGLHRRSTRFLAFYCEVGSYTAQRSGIYPEIEIQPNYREKK